MLHTLIPFDLDTETHTSCVRFPTRGNTIRSAVVRRAWCLSFIVFALYLPAYGYNSFDISNSEPCPGDSVVVIATWCPPPERGWTPEPPEITVLSGSPSPFLVLVESGQTTDGAWWHYRAGPNPGRLLLTADSGYPEKSTYSASIRIRGDDRHHSDCSTCGDAEGSQGFESISILDGPRVEFAIGSIKPDEQSPAHPVRLVFASQTPTAAFADPNSLNISGMPLWGVAPARICDFRGDPDACFSDENCGVLSVTGFDSSAVVKEISDSEYEVRLHEGWAELNFDPPCEPPHGGCCPLEPMILKWRVNSPSDDQLIITRMTPTDDVEVEYDIECTDGNRSWQVTTGDGSVDYRIESVVWIEEQPNQWRRDHTVELRSSADTWYTHSKRSTWHGASVDNPWTVERIDPDSLYPLETRRLFLEEGEFAGAVEWQENADGSWEWYEYPADFSIANALVRVNRGWTDDARPASISGWGTRTETTYVPKVTRTDGEGRLTVAGLTVGLKETYVQYHRISKFLSEVAPGGDNARLEWLYWNPSEALMTTVLFYNYTPYGSDGTAPFPPFPADRWIWESKELPTGVVTDRTFNTRDAIFYEDSWTVALVGSSHGGSGRTIQSVRNFPASSSVESFDQAGRLKLASSCWDTDPTSHTEWTYYKYDKRGRIEREVFSNRTERITDWDDYSCCRVRTVIEPDGTRTRFEQDPVGRPMLEVHAIGSQKREIKQYVYGTAAHEGRTLPAVTVLHGDDALAFEDPVGTFAVLRRTQTIYDLAERVVAEIMLDSSEEVLLKTTYAYGVTPEGGRQVTTTRPDGETEVRAYYRDGQLKSVTGTGVVPKYYVYSAAAGSVTTTEYTGSNPSDRYATTTRDMLGRVVSEQRPGWSSSGTETLTTTYFYDGHGDLEKVETRDSSEALVGAPNIYDYERSGAELIERVGIDLSDPYNDQLELLSNDRYTETITSSETDGSLTYRMKTIKAVEDSGVERVLSVAKDLVGGFTSVTNPDAGAGARVIGQRRMLDERGDEIIETTTLDDTACTRRMHTKHSDWTNTAVDTWECGLRVSSLSRTGVQTDYNYDGIGRIASVTDGRTTTNTSYNAIGRVWLVWDADNRTTEYRYYLQNEPGAGQVKQVIDALGKDTYYAYDEHGRITHTWGDTPQPTWIEYTELYGERWKLHTYREPDIGWDSASWPSVGDGDVTAWTYDEATGLLETKTYADTTAVDYEYTADGLLYRRLWARSNGGQRVTTTYGHDPQTSEVLTITYSDGTPSVTMTHDRRGRVDTVTQSGSFGVNYDYDYSLWPASVSVAASGLYNKTMTQTYDAAQGGQLTGLTIGADYDADYHYLAATGRLDRVTGPGLPTGAGSDHGAEYVYMTGSDLVGETRVVDANDITLVRSVRGYESNRDLVDGVQNIWNPTSTDISRYDYANDDLARRDGVWYSGVAFGSPATPIHEDYDYNPRDELTFADRDDTVPTDWQYDYDPIGNRETLTQDDTVPTDYVSNALNQYDRWDRVASGAIGREGYNYDADGNLVESWLAGDMNCDGTVSLADISLFSAAVACYTAEDPEACWEAKYPGLDCPFIHADINGDGVVNLADINPFTPLVAQPGDTGVARLYTWDAENRLRRVEPSGTIEPEHTLVEFAYDHQGRRVEKKVFGRNLDNTAWEVVEHRKFVWSGWLMVMELDGLNSDAVVRKQTWGLDLAGLNGQLNSLESAGGIGGLLAVDQAEVGGGAAAGGVDAGTYYFAYDANGNVGQIVAWTENFGGTTGYAWDTDPATQARLVAHYEYDPYGNAIETIGTYATANPWRFSTKQFDDETSLGYWGYRYYSPALGRWMSRDPIGVTGGVNVYAYVANGPMWSFDAVGTRFEPPPPREFWPDPPKGTPPPPVGLPPRVPSGSVGGRDRLDLWCYRTPFSTGPGNHCALLCNGERMDGTGPGSGPLGNPDGNGNPGVVTGTPPPTPVNPRPPNNGDLPSDSKWSGGTSAPAGTCNCIAAAAQRLNAIPKKYYGITDSNSNSALNCVLKACKVSMSPSGWRGTGWNTSVMYNCHKCIYPWDGLGTSSGLFCDNVKCGELFSPGANQPSPPPAAPCTTCYEVSGPIPGI